MPLFQHARTGDVRNVPVVLAASHEKSPLWTPFVGPEVITRRAAPIEGTTPARRRSTKPKVPATPAEQPTPQHAQPTPQPTPKPAQPSK